MLGRNVERNLLKQLVVDTAVTHVVDRSLTKSIVKLRAVLEFAPKFWFGLAELLEEVATIACLKVQARSIEVRAGVGCPEVQACGACGSSDDAIGSLCFHSGIEPDARDVVLY